MAKKREVENVRIPFGDLCEWELNFLLAKSLGYPLRLKNEHTFFVDIPEEGRFLIIKNNKDEDTDLLFSPAGDWCLVGKVLKEICPNCRSMTDGTYIVSKGLLSIHGQTFQDAVLKLYLLLNYGYVIDPKEFVLRQRAKLQVRPSVKADSLCSGRTEHA